MDTAQIILSVLVGIGLAAACGFRVFIPPFIMSIGAMSGYIELSDSFSWMGTLPALIAFGVAASIEVIAYFIPVVENGLKAVATPFASVAGIVLTAAVLPADSMWLKWSLAVMAGGSISTTTHLVNTGLRTMTNSVTAGIGGIFVSFVEMIAAVSMTVLAIVAPIILVIMVMISAIVIFRYRKRIWHGLVNNRLVQLAVKLKNKLKHIKQ